jgi:3'(2'), 5'-bisphosphate nucleotidase
MNYQKELDLAIEAARKAGNILLNQKELNVTSKQDGTPVSEADKASSKFLSEFLLKNFPDYGLLDEEQEEDNSRFSKQLCWIIDPLDSTKSYINNIDSYSVLIGLIKDFEPILGVSYRPKIDELVYAVKGHGSFLIKDNKSPIKLSVSNSTDINLLISKTRFNENFKKTVEKLNPNSLNFMGGSTKIIEIAKGSSNLYISPKENTMNLWDVCAPSIILSEAGGLLTDLQDNQINFSNKQVELNNGLIASNNLLHEKIIKSI